MIQAVPPRDPQLLQPAEPSSTWGIARLGGWVVKKGSTCISAAKTTTSEYVVGKLKGLVATVIPLEKVLKEKEELQKKLLAAMQGTADLSDEERQNNLKEVASLMHFTDVLLAQVGESIARKLFPVSSPEERGGMQQLVEFNIRRAVFNLATCSVKTFPKEPILTGILSIFAKKLQSHENAQQILQFGIKAKAKLEENPKNVDTDPLHIDQADVKAYEELFNSYADDLFSLFFPAGVGNLYLGNSWTMSLALKSAGLMGIGGRIKTILSSYLSQTYESFTKDMQTAQSQPPAFLPEQRRLAAMAEEITSKALQSALAAEGVLSKFEVGKMLDSVLPDYETAQWVQENIRGFAGTEQSRQMRFFLTAILEPVLVAQLVKTAKRNFPRVGEDSLGGQLFSHLFEEALPERGGAVAELRSAIKAVESAIEAAEKGVPPQPLDRALVESHAKAMRSFLERHKNQLIQEAEAEGIKKKLALLLTKLGVEETGDILARVVEGINTFRVGDEVAEDVRGLFVEALASKRDLEKILKISENRAKLDAEFDQMEGVQHAKFKDRDSWERVVQFLKSRVSADKGIAVLQQRRDSLQQQLLEAIPSYKAFAVRLQKMLGLDLDGLGLPDALNRILAPSLSSLFETQVAPCLFLEADRLVQLASTTEMDADRQKLDGLAGSQMLSGLAGALSKSLMLSLSGMVGDAEKLAMIVLQQANSEWAQQDNPQLTLESLKQALQGNVPEGEAIDDLAERVLQQVNRKKSFVEKQASLQLALKGNKEVASRVLQRLMSSLAPSLTEAIRSQVFQVTDAQMGAVIRNGVPAIPILESALIGRVDGEQASRLASLLHQKLDPTQNLENQIGCVVRYTGLSKDNAKEYLTLCYFPDGLTTPKRIADAYVSAYPAHEAQRAAIQTLLSSKEVSGQLQFLINTDVVGEALASQIPGMRNSSLAQVLSKEIHTLVQGSGVASVRAREFFQKCLEGVLLKIWIKMVEKYPVREGKDMLVQVAEKMLELSLTAYKDYKAGTKSIDQVAFELSRAILVDLLQIDTEDALVEYGVPPALKGIVYQALNSQFKTILKEHFKEAVDSLEAAQKAGKKTAQEKLKAYNLPTHTGADVVADVVVHDIGNFVVDLMRDILGGKNIPTGKAKGVHALKLGLVGSLLQPMAKQGNFKEVAALLLGYTGAPMEQFLGSTFAAIGPDKDVPDAAAAGQLVGDLFVRPIHSALKKVFDFETGKGRDFDIRLMSGVLAAAADHFEIINQAQAHAGEGAPLTHQGLVEAAGDKLSPMTVRKKMDFEPIAKNILDVLRMQKVESLEIVKQKLADLAEDEAAGRLVLSSANIAESVAASLRLTDAQKGQLRNLTIRGQTLVEAVRQEAQAAVKQRKEALYIPASKACMQLFFPEGYAKGLDFVPKKFRRSLGEEVFEKQVIPIVLESIVGAVFNPDTLDSIVMNSLQQTNLSLVPKPAGAPEPALTVEEQLGVGQLNKAGGRFMQQLLLRTDLPSRIKNKLSTPEMMPLLGASLWGALKGQLKGEFVATSIKKGLENAAVRRGGKSMLAYSAPQSKEEVQQRTLRTEQGRAAVRKQIQAELSKLPGNSIAYLIGSKWIESQAAFDRAIVAVFGKVGKGLKIVLDAVFNLIFFKIVGALLSILFWPLKKGIEEVLGRYLMSRVLNPIMDPLKKAPADQPKIAGDFVAFNDNLVAGLYGAIRQVLEGPLVV